MILGTYWNNDKKSTHNPHLFSVDLLLGRLVAKFREMRVCARFCTVVPQKVKIMHCHRVYLPNFSNYGSRLIYASFNQENNSEFTKQMYLKIVFCKTLSKTDIYIKKKIPLTTRLSTYA